jgi:hypothetical protein
MRSPGRTAMGISDRYTNTTDLMFFAHDSPGSKREGGSTEWCCRPPFLILQSRLAIESG